MKRSVFVLAAVATLTVGSRCIAAGSDTISPKEMKSMIAALNHRMEGMQLPEVDGFDRKSGTVKPQPQDFEKRKQWIEDTLHANDKRDYEGAKQACGLTQAPQIDIDIAVVTMWRANGQGQPVPNIFEALWDGCGNPPNEGIKKFARSIKTIHVSLADPYPYTCPSGACGYSFKFDKKSKTLLVGVHEVPTDISKHALPFLKQQAL